MNVGDVSTIRARSLLGVYVQMDEAAPSGLAEAALAALVGGALVGTAADALAADRGGGFGAWLDRLTMRGVGCRCPSSPQGGEGGCERERADG